MKLILAFLTALFAGNILYAQQNQISTSRILEKIVQNELGIVSSLKGNEQIHQEINLLQINQDSGNDAIKNATKTNSAGDIENDIFLTEKDKRFEEILAHQQREMEEQMEIERQKQLEEIRENYLHTLPEKPFLKSTSSTTTINETDSLALVALYNSTNGSNWTIRTNWLTGSVSTWYGIIVTSGRVTKISLANNNLTGFIPADLRQLTNLTDLYLYNNKLTGSIPIDLGQLTNLKRLTLGYNQLTDSIPIELGKLTNLGELNIYHNQLTGSIPHELGQLINLQSLNLGWNKLSGSIPSDLGQLINLWSLDLDNNQLTGSIPPDLGQLINLARLFLDFNQLTGSIPAELGQLRNLNDLWLLNNKLTGSIPPELGQLAMLKTMYLNINQLTGSIPAELGQLSNLENLVIARNQLTGSIPTELGQLSNLKSLFLDRNKLTGSIPAELGQLPELVNLWLFENQLSDSIPTELGQLTNLLTLWLYGNQLTGSIPIDLIQLTNLQELYLSSNKLTGSLSAELAHLTNLQKLDLSYNLFTGSIPTELGQLTKLQELYLNSNKLTGFIPKELGQLTNLQKLYLNMNQLAGSIPVEISQMINLKYMYVQSNLLDSIPDLVVPIKLINFNISDNKFTFEDLESNMDISQKVSNFYYSPQKPIGQPDTISLNNGDNFTFNVLCGGTQNRYQWYKDVLPLGDPADSSQFYLENFGLEVAGSYVCKITNVLVPKLTLQSSEILLKVIEPPCNVQDSLILVNLYNATTGINWTNKTNWLTGPVNTWFGITVANGRVTQIKLSNNNLTGYIIAELGQLANLQYLYLNGNQLTGTIPVEMGQNTKLIYLDISQNQLTGSIPVELGQLINLKYMFLSFNKLSGAIPPELGQMANLQVLWLWENQLTGSIPDELGKLTNLYWLYLPGNQLTGSIPAEIGQLTNLEVLDLSDNRLIGSIPAELGQLTKLYALGLYKNQLTGSIPVELDQLIKLNYLWLNENLLTGAIPVEISQMATLKEMDVHSNQLDFIPDLTVPANLSDLIVSNNKFTFEDLEYNMDLIPSVIFTYSPQDSIGIAQKVTKKVGENFNYIIATEGKNNHYQWYKDSTLLPLQISDTLNLENLKINDYGDYHCEVTNTSVPDLTLYSRVITINVMETTVCLTLDFKTGWNIFSSPLVLDSTNLKTIFQPLIDNNALVKIQDEGGNSMEDWGIFGGWQDNIGNISPTEGYKIKVNKTDSVEICGVPVDYPFSVPLNEGWNIMGYPQTKTVDGLYVVQQLIDRGTLIKVQDELGNSIEDWGIFGGWTDGIGDFTAGEGYKIKVSAKDTIWIYENYPKSTTILHEHIATFHFQPEYEGNGVDHMNINLVGLPVNLLKVGDELAIFDGSTCVGAVTLMPHHLKNQSVSIAASAIDNQGMPGFEEGNPITLKLWKSINNQEFALEPEIVKGSSTFTKHETTVASLENYATTGLDGIPGSNSCEINCYPNPFSDEVTIEINLVADAKVEVEVVNQLGQLVKTIATKQLLPGGLHKLTWNGKNAGNGEVAPGIYHLRFEIGDSIVHRKIVLSK